MTYEQYKQNNQHNQHKMNKGHKMHQRHKWLPIIVVILTGFAILMYQQANQPKFCGDQMIELNETQVVKANVLDVLTAKEIQTIVGTSSDGLYTVYGNFEGVCNVPKQFIGYEAVFSTWYRDVHQVFHVAAFLEDQYEPLYQDLLANGVETKKDLVIQETSVFWRKHGVYYAIKGKPELIEAFVEAKVYE